MFRIYPANLYKFFISSDDLSNSLLSLLFAWYSMNECPTVAVEEVWLKTKNLKTPLQAVSP